MITSICSRNYVEIEVTDDGKNEQGTGIREFRRYSAEGWQQLWGNSWEEYYNCEKLEKEYQIYIEQIK